jgi:drug/metabolite transporter (DMT)-like permease
MRPNILLAMCVLIWGFTTFIQKLAVDKMSPLLMQIVVAMAFVFCIPIFIQMEGGVSHLKWNTLSVVLTFGAALLSITGNILMYTALTNNKHLGSAVMLVSLYPAVTLILSAIFLHEHFSFGKILGFLAMVGGALLLTFC